SLDQMGCPAHKRPRLSRSGTRTNLSGFITCGDGFELTGIWVCFPSWGRLSITLCGEQQCIGQLLHDEIDRNTDFSCDCVRIWDSTRATLAELISWQQKLSCKEIRLRFGSFLGTIGILVSDTRHFRLGWDQ